MKHSILTALVALAMLSSCNYFSYRNEKADLIVRNARIHSMDGTNTIHKAMAIKDGRIIELGAEFEILNRYRAPVVYDAGTRPVYPGFIDAHSHFTGYGMSLQQVRLTGTRSWSEVLQRLQAYAEAHPGKGWLLGRGWDQNLWPDRTNPVNDSLNVLFPDRPVLLRRVDGHAGIANQTALERVGYSVSTTVEGGSLARRDGRLTGLLLDNALLPFNQVMDHPDEATLRKALLDAQRDCLAVGLTMVSDAGLDASTIDLIKAMQEEGALKLRVYAMLADDSANFTRFASGPLISDRLVVRAVKCFADGALGSRGALLLEPYADDPEAGYGLQLHPRAHFVEVAKWCKEHGFQMATHAIGDSANRLMLGVYGEMLGGTNDLRWRIEHAQVVDPDDFDLFAEYNVIPSMQPTHATSDMAWAGDRLGPERLANAYALNRLMQQNGMIALGTDFPVEGIDPLKTFEAAVFRQNDKGQPEGGFQMGDALSREQALRGMTTWNALATFTEEQLGSLEPGKEADFVVLDRDLMTMSKEHLRQAKVVATFIKGEKVWER